MNIYTELFKEFLGLLIGIAIFVPGLVITRKRVRLLKRSKKVRGKVLRIIQDEDEAFSSLYYPVVEFKTAEKETIIKQYHVGSQFTTYGEDTIVNILYDKADPKKFIIDSVRDEYTGVILITVGIVTIVISIALFVFYMMIWIW